MKNKAKKTAINIPGIGYMLRSLNYGLRSPKYHDITSAKINELAESINQLQASLESFRESQGLFAEDPLIDAFYTNFENVFRGSRDTVIERMSDYKSYFKKSKVNFNKFKVIDIGSGRGEFLEYAKKNSINALGIDLNSTMVEQCLGMGLNAKRADAIQYLQESKAESIGAVTGFHIVEHIPFQVLLKLFYSAHHAIVKEGFVIFETPNPENIIVATNSFYNDPSHLKPIPPELLKFSLEVVGFRNVKILRLHPIEKDKLELPKEISDKFYGPRDYAVIGYK